MDYNCWHGLGRLTRDPETRNAGGSKVAKFGFAVGNKWKDKTSGEMKEKTTFVEINAWGGLADTVEKYCQKGTQLLVIGRLDLDTWEDNEGNKRQKLYITANQIILMPKGSNSGGERRHSQGQNEDEQEDQNMVIPF